MRDLGLVPISPAQTCSQETRLRVLRSVRWFAEMDDAAIVQLNDRVRSLTWPAGGRLHTQGEPATALHLIAAGAVKLLVTNADGVERIVEVAVPGDMVGILPVLRRMRYVASAVALQTTCALRIDMPLFQRTILENPSVGLQVIDDLAAKLASSRTREGASTAPVESRVASMVDHLARTIGRPDDRGIMLELPLSRADIAQMVGSTEESVSRVMSAWKRDGIIQSGRRWTRILDVEALRALVRD